MELIGKMYLRMKYKNVSKELEPLTTKDENNMKLKKLKRLENPIKLPTHLNALTKLACLTKIACVIIQ